MKTTLAGLALLLACTASAATRHNDHSCDISVAPAATLLLPYFEVDVERPRGETTIFTVTNASGQERVVRITLWSDYAYPTLTFNIRLAGYDVQSVNLFDVLARGLLPASSCGQPGRMQADTVARLQRVFLEGWNPGVCNSVGDEHDDAVGYATIDLVRSCSQYGPMDEEYWTEDLAWDNVLIGDYEQVDPQNGFAQGSPLVHIRAIPEGGTHQQRAGIETPFPRTFYARYQPASAPKLDARQPLPSAFAVRWITGGTSHVQTFLKIWREGPAGARTCATWDDNYQFYTEVVVFDEAENAVADVPESRVTPITTELMLPATSLKSADDTRWFPRLTNGAISGWMYLNLHPLYIDEETSSNWVVSSMRAEGRYAADMDAAALGNGCSPAAPASEVSIGTATIGPRP